MVLIIILGGVWWFGSQEKTIAPIKQIYSSEDLNLSFEYPEGYFVEEIDRSAGERKQHAIVIFEDNQFNRDLVAGKITGTDAPPTITISLFQNDLDNYTARNFIEETNFSNFKLSDGTLTETKIAGEPALRYWADGLWQNYNTVVARSDYVYMFTVSFNSPEDELISVFEKLLKTVKFSSSGAPTSADNTPPGSIHNLPVPEAVEAARKMASETYNIPGGETIVMSAFEREWPDSCLGLANEDEMCAQVITPGYEVVVKAGQGEYTYRTNSDGSQIREDK